MKKQIFAASVLLVIVVAVIVAGIALVAQKQPLPVVQGADDNAAIPIYVSNTDMTTRTYRTEQRLPLNTWQPITVYGETFPACTILHEGSTDTILTVDPEESKICGVLSLSPLGE